MKKTLTFLFLTLLTLALLVACGHAHTYSEEWSGDDDNHWREATCEHTEEKADFGTHVDSDENGKCDTCEATLHQHTYTISWQNDDTKHWHEATCSHDTLRSDEAAHVDEDEDGRCDVCMYDGMHKHVFNTAMWKSDETGHWHPGMCEGVDHSDRKSEFAPHTTAENDGTCDVCGYDDMHIHTYDTTDFSYDDTHHWYKMTCEHGEVKYGLEEHNSSLNNGVCDTCGKDGLHIHTFSNSEYASNAEGHWFKANCGHDDYVFNLQPHTDTDSDNYCDTCTKQLRFTVTVVAKQTDFVTVVGYVSPMTVDLGDDAAFVVKVKAGYILYVTTGGGRIVGIPTTSGGITTYNVVLEDIDEDTKLTLVAKLENGVDLSALPGTPESVELTKTVYKQTDGSFFGTGAPENAYTITYVNGTIVTYDAELDTYKLDKVATIKSIKDANGEETTIEWQGVTYGSTGAGVTTVIPTRDWLGLSGGFRTNHDPIAISPVTVYEANPEAIAVFESDVVVERVGTGSGFVFEIYLSGEGTEYAAKAAIGHAGGNAINAYAIRAGETGGASETNATLGNAFKLKIVATQNPDNTSKMDVVLYVNGVQHSNCTVDKVNNLRLKLMLRDDGPNGRNSIVTFSNTKFVQLVNHTHTFNENEWLFDEDGHWNPATCDHADVKGNYVAHDSATNNGTCDVCGKENIHVHTFSETEYASNADGHWLRANCGHDDYVYNLQPHVDTEDENGFCDECGMRLNYSVSVSIKQPERIEVVGNSTVNAPIGEDVTFTVKVNSKYILFVTEGGGEIVGMPTTEGGITTYTVKVARVDTDTNVVLVAKLENAYALSTIPTAEGTTKTVTIYESEGTYSTEDNGGTKYEITYVNSAITTYDADDDAYTVEKVARIVSIKNAAGEETTLTRGTTTYGAEGDGVVTEIPVRNWLFESDDSKRNFISGHSAMIFNSTEVLSNDETLLYTFETDVLVTDAGTGPIFELYFSYGNNNYLAKTALRHDDGKLKVSAMTAGAGEGGFTECGEVGTKVNLRIEVRKNETDATKLDVTLYVNDALHSTCTVEDKGDLKVRLSFRDDGTDRNNVATFSDARFLKLRLHEHTFDTTDWVYDDYGHWHAASCGHSAKGDYAEHSSATNNGICDVCGKENIHVHTSSDTEYAHDVNGHWHKANCGHDDYIADREGHVDTADNNGVCDICERRLVCVVTVDLNSTFALLVTDGEIAAAPGADATFEVSVPATHTLVVVGGEIVGEPTESAGVKVYTVKVAALADDTTVEVYTKRADYTLSLGDVEATTHTVTVFEKDGAFSTTDNGGIKYVITYVNNIEKKLNADLGSYTFTKVARITSIKDANGAATTLEYNGVTYGASGDGVATVIPDRTWLGTDNAFRGYGNYSDIWCQAVTEGDALFHFEADMLIEHNTECAGTSIIDLFFVDNNGNAATGMSIYYYPGADGKLTFIGFGVGGVDYAGGNTVVEAKVGEVFNLAFDIVAGTEAGTYDVITYVNGEVAMTDTISSLTADSRFRFDMRDDGVDRNAVITISNVNFTKKQ